MNLNICTLHPKPIAIILSFCAFNTAVYTNTVKSYVEISCLAKLGSLRKQINKEQIFISF